ncbi:MAG: restriction endonuclease subunit S [Caldilineaceae bacterium]
MAHNHNKLVRFAQLLTRSQERISIEPEQKYQQITVRMWGKGVVERGIIQGSAIAAPSQFVAHTGQFIMSRIDARNGAYGLVPATLDGAVVTNDFPLFFVNTTEILPAFLAWMSKTRRFVDLCIAASEGTTNRVRLQEDRFLATEIPLPPLDEQRRIVARIEALAGRVAEAQRLRTEVREQAHQMLQSVYHDLIHGVPHQKMKHVAPIVRRPIEVDMEQDYYELGIRSFGKGTFHKPAIKGADVGSKRIFQIEPGDLLFSNVFSWEGAIAVVKPMDKGRVGSHRFISCVPKSGLATANFLCFHFLTLKGLIDIGEASPGGAGRNRTLGLTKLEEIEVPVPPYEKQLWFDSLIAKVDAISSTQSANQAELDALMPVILDKAFRGEL